MYLPAKEISDELARPVGAIEANAVKVIEAIDGRAETVAIDDGGSCCVGVEVKCHRLVSIVGECRGRWKSPYTFH